MTDVNSTMKQSEFEANACIGPKRRKGAIGFGAEKVARTLPTNLKANRKQTQTIFDTESVSKSRFIMPYKIWGMHLDNTKKDCHLTNYDVISFDDATIFDKSLITFTSAVRAQTRTTSGRSVSVLVTACYCFISHRSDFREQDRHKWLRQIRLQVDVHSKSLLLFTWNLSENVVPSCFVCGKHACAHKKTVSSLVCFSRFLLPPC